MEPRIAEITAADTATIRDEVLRRGTPSDSVEFPGDHDPSTLHLGAYADGELVAISTWLQRLDPPAEVLWPGDDGVVTVQLRGMATVERCRGTGLGMRLVDAGLDHARRIGARVVWARARDTALGFYEHAGFEVVGDGFLQPETQLPHHLIRRRPQI